MSSSFELMVEFNYEFFDVVIKSNDKLIAFKEVFNEIKSQLDFDFSLKYNSFEIWDKKFGFFAKVFNENQIIENLSIIRIKFKDTQLLNDFLKNCHQNSHSIEKAIIPVIKPPEEGSVSFEEQNSTKDNVSEITSIDSKNTSFMSAISQLKDKKRIESLKLKFQKFSNKTEEEVLKLKALTKCIETVAKRFGSTNDLDNFWDKVAEQMESNGFLISGKQCKQIKDLYINYYYGLVLTHMSDYRSATEVYPLFGLIDSINWSHCLSPKAYGILEDLKNKFKKKCKTIDQ